MVSAGRRPEPQVQGPARVVHCRHTREGVASLLHRPSQVVRLPRMGASALVVRGRLQAD